MNMLEVIKGNKTVKVPGKVITVGIVAAGVCAIVSDICNAVSSKR
jgi:hypothetical protein